MKLTGLPRLLVVLAWLSPAAALAQVPPVRVVLFTHIEDNTPAGTLGTTQNRQNYLTWRTRLLDVANLMHDAGLPWSLQPDWKLLRCALLFEDATLMQSTNNKNFLRYLKEDLGVIIDPHSHEGGGYNYTDVAHLIDSLRVGTSTVIGGHVWDPASPQFQEWDRYRVPVSGQRYPNALWRGDILMGSGTLNHLDDPVVSGVWQPQDRDHYFTHDPAGNIAAVGQYKGTIEAIPELHDLYVNGTVSTQHMLTSSFGIRPAVIQRADGLVSITDSVIAPLTTWRDAGTVLPTDFTALVDAWRTEFGSRGYLYDAENPPTDINGLALVRPIAVLEPTSPNPFRSATVLRVRVDRLARIRLAIYDTAGREVTRLAESIRQPGLFVTSWTATEGASGVYFCRLTATDATGRESPALEKKLLLIR
jgi:hypothetical protein